MGHAARCGGVVTQSTAPGCSFRGFGLDTKRVIGPRYVPLASASRGWRVTAFQLLCQLVPRRRPTPSAVTTDKQNNEASITYPLNKPRVYLVGCVFLQANFCSLSIWIQNNGCHRSAQFQAPRRAGEGRERPHQQYVLAWIISQRTKYSLSADRSIS